jgi:thiol:disulfide interchange protein DsbD
MKSLGFWALALTGMLLIVPERAGAQPARKTFDEVLTRIEAEVEPAEARRGQTVTWRLKVTVLPGWHSYPTAQVDPEAASYLTQIKFERAAGDAVFVGGLKEPAFHTKPEPDLNVKELRYLEGNLVWERSAVIPPDAKPGEMTVEVPVRIYACDENNFCLSPRDIPTRAKVRVSDAPPVEVESQYRAEVTGALAVRYLAPWRPVAQFAGSTLMQWENSLASLRSLAAAPASAAGTPQAPRAFSPASPGSAPAPTPARDWWKTLQADLADILARLIPLAGTAKGNVSGLVALMLTGALWGLITLVTPCVFPMIPITVSLFLKQGEKAHVSPVKLAAVYCGTIVLVMTVAALTLLSLFRWLSVDPLMNLALGALFVYFALSLFGLYDIRLPNFLTRYTAAHEKQGGLVGTVFMALTFSLVSFTCVAPFLGGFGALAASGQFNYFELTLGGLAFAASFAAPFFVLALFPTLLRKLPRSGDWLTRVKVVMGFLELAAALKFFRTAELRWLPVPEYFTYDLVLSIWVALAVVVGLYLLNVFRMGHDAPEESIGVARLLFGVGFMALGLYLLPAVFKAGNSGESQRPAGAVYAWVDAFLLPEPGQADLAASGDLKGTLDEALREKKLVFVDFTGKTCTNCKYNERNIFPRGPIHRLMKQYKIVQLYTDEVPEAFYPQRVPKAQREDDADSLLKFQRDAFKIEQLPLYVLLEPQPDGKIRVVDIYTEGKINDESAFAEFLRRGLDSGKRQVAAAGR